MSDATPEAYLKKLKSKHTELRKAAESKSRGHASNCMSPSGMFCNCDQEKRINEYARIWCELDALLDKIEEE